MFAIADYLMVAVFYGLSVIIGLYHGCKSKKVVSDEGT